MRSRFARYVCPGLVLASALVDSPLAAAERPAPPPAMTQPGAPCGALVDVSRGVVPNPSTVIESAALIPSAPPAPSAPAGPEHCEVFGRMNERTGIDSRPYAIRFHMRLPSAWNGRLFFEGGGGTNGNLGGAWGYLQGRQRTNALALGYAVVTQNGGHDNAAGKDGLPDWNLSFGFDPQARVDFGYNSYDQVTRAAKALIRAYYGRPAEKSYYVGCSEGGREGMMMSQRFPESYDGVLAVAPGLRLPRASLVGEAWDSQAFAEVARSAGLLDRFGQPLLNKTFTDRDLVLVSTAVRSACDALDGLEDGILDDFPRCRSDAVRPELEAVTCKGPKTEACLSSSQVAALYKVFDGARNAKREPLYADWPWDTGIGDSVANSTFEGWRRWKLGPFESEVNTALNATMGAGAAASLFTTPPRGPAADGAGFLAYLLGIDFDRDVSTLTATSGAFAESSSDFMMASRTDLSSFTRRGGKLVVVHGVSDPVFSINDTIGWWKDVDAASGGRAAESVRLFAVPGMAHCGTGPSTDQFDAFAALVAWVESGAPPERITATARESSPWPGRTRPLCPFPRQARYRGEGSIEDAGSFTCR